VARKAVLNAFLNANKREQRHMRSGRFSIMGTAFQRVPLGDNRSII